VAITPYSDTPTKPSEKIESLRERYEWEEVKIYGIGRTVFHCYYRGDLVATGLLIFLKMVVTRSKKAFVAYLLFSFICFWGTVENLTGDESAARRMHTILTGLRNYLSESKTAASY